MGRTFITKSKRRIRQLIGQELWTKTELDCETIKVPGWCYCPVGINSGSMVFSLGVGNDIRFDQDVMSRFSCHVHAFDPTPRWIEWIKTLELPTEFHFHPCAIGDYDGSMTMFPRVPRKGKRSSRMLTTVNEGLEAGDGIQVSVRKVSSILKELQLDAIDILKMDIEAAEYEVIDDILSDNVEVYQILVEFHHRFKTVPLEKTRRAVEKLHQAGYRVFYISDKAREYSFIREDLYQKYLQLG